jgi:hypothetical protein
VREAERGSQPRSLVTLALLSARQAEAVNSLSRMSAGRLDAAVVTHPADQPGIVQVALAALIAVSSPGARWTGR